MVKNKIKESANTLFKSTIGGFIFGVGLTIAILVALYFILSLQNTIKILIEPTSEGIGLFNATTTFLLALITAVYVYFTYQIAKGSEEVVKQTEVDRKIAFTEKQLEKFYYPLKDALIYDKEIPNESDRYVLVGESYSIDTIIPYQYLVRKETKSKLDEYIARKQGISKQLTTPVDLSCISEELFDIISNDIKKLNEELSELIE